MFNKEEFKRNAYSIIDWIAEYYEDVDKIPVRSQVMYGDIKKQLPEHPPISAENIDSIFNDFKRILMPGITHWQSPNYFAYFPANSSEPSLLAEFLTAALGVQGMKWITSPAATELEEVTTNWLRQMIGLPEEFSGVIQDSASVSTLCAILAAREKCTKIESNFFGIGNHKLRIYCSVEAHSSIEKAVRIAGLGSNNLVKIPVDKYCRMIAKDLEQQINQDINEGYIPACIVAALGTTGTCAIDPISEIAIIARKYSIWLHVDGAFAGTALILPEFRSSIDGLEQADSLVFNPHKWMFTNFDCSTFFVKDKEHLQNTFRLVPVYLQTQKNTDANDFSNWGIQLGRRFRSLKLWFVIRNFGLEGIQKRVRKHISLAQFVEETIIKKTDFELIVPRNLSVVCFRYKPLNKPESELNEINANLLELVNSTGKTYLSHTIVDNKFTIRFVCAQTHTEKQHVEQSLETIFNCAQKLG